MLVIHNDWYVTMIRKQESRDLDFEAMFCHQCDDSLAGHRFVIIIMVKMKLMMMVRIQQMKALCHQCNHSLAGLLIWGLLKDGGTDNHDDQHVFVTITYILWFQSCQTKDNSDDFDDPLVTRYVLREDFPYCIKCYENVFANNCDECGKIIGIDSKVTKQNCYFSRQLNPAKTSTVLHCFCQAVLHPSDPAARSF